MRNRVTGRHSDHATLRLGCRRGSPYDPVDQQQQRHSQHHSKAVQPRHNLQHIKSCAYNRKRNLTVVVNILPPPTLCKASLQHHLLLVVCHLLWPKLGIGGGLHNYAHALRHELKAEIC
jgi:hypothetical protein